MWQLKDEKSSLLITTNLEFSRWSELFIDPINADGCAYRPDDA